MMSNDNPIFWQDEILQMMYWMRGEGLGEVVSLKNVNQFLRADEDKLKENVRRLVEKGFLSYSQKQDDGTERILLTQLGINEGKRRFKDEFENYLGHESHLVCDDPDCDCHDPDWEGTCTHLLENHPHDHKG